MWDLSLLPPLFIDLFCDFWTLTAAGDMLTLASFRLHCFAFHFFFHDGQPLFFLLLSPISHCCAESESGCERDLICVRFLRRGESSEGEEPLMHDYGSFGSGRIRSLALTSPSVLSSYQYTDTPI